MENASVNSSLSGGSKASNSRVSRADAKLKGRTSPASRSPGDDRPKSPNRGDAAGGTKPASAFWDFVASREDALNASVLALEVEKGCTRVVRSRERVDGVNQAILDARGVNDLSRVAALKVELKAAEKKW
mmetsp:Transcript_12184/g.28563  ORF Transcript_12184/g.28563 Transcript_12184/m.28563 type:complete len:130 (+) Transcript_12184:136-525(+)